MALPTEKIAWSKLKRYREFLAFLSISLIFLLPTFLGGETITLKTYYPSPYGSYQKMKITKSLTAGDGTSPLTVDGNLVIIGSATVNMSAPGTYTNGPVSAVTQFDIAGAAAANDIYIKKAGKWVSQMGSNLQLGQAFRKGPTIYVIKGPAEAFIPINNVAAPANSRWITEKSKLDGIACNEAKGWVLGGCWSAGYELSDLDLVPYPNGCVTNDIDDEGTRIEMSISCINFANN